MCLNCGCDGHPHHSHGDRHHHHQLHHELHHELRDRPHAHTHTHNPDRLADDVENPSPTGAERSSSGRGATTTIAIETKVLVRNDTFAARNRQRFRDRGLLAVNLMSSPGAGKTALLERTLAEFHDTAAAIVGDLATDNDAQRLQRSGAPVTQIETGAMCHLEADLVFHAVDRLALSRDREFLFVENVGNLVCPAAYDLGEDLRVVLFSVTEGEDKPLKYPTTFKLADAVLLTKIDIAAAVECDRDLAIANIRRVAPQAAILEVSARTGEGMTAWYDFLRERRL